MSAIIRRSYPEGEHKERTEYDEYRRASTVDFRTKPEPEDDEPAHVVKSATEVFNDALWAAAQAVAERDNDSPVNSVSKLMSGSRELSIAYVSASRGRPVPGSTAALARAKYAAATAPPGKALAAAVAIVVKAFR